MIKRDLPPVASKKSEAEDFEIVVDGQSPPKDEFEIIQNTDENTQDFYNSSTTAPTGHECTREFFYRGLSYVGFHYGNKKLHKLENHVEAYLLHGSRYELKDFPSLLTDFQALCWITYCKKFKPLLIETGKWGDKTVKNMRTDRQWGCTIRCLQMLVANSISYLPEFSIR